MRFRAAAKAPFPHELVCGKAGKIRAIFSYEAANLRKSPNQRRTRTLLNVNSSVKAEEFLVAVKQNSCKRGQERISGRRQFLTLLLT